VDGTFLAVAGLKRLDMHQHITEAISTEQMLPAVAQGAIGVECLTKNEHIQRVIAKINHEESNVRITAERGFLKALNGSCSTPIGALCTYQVDGSILLKGMIADLAGNEIHTVERTGRPDQAWDIGADAGEELLSKYGDLLR
jgi:hydroxymethylbilane synthase